MSRQLDLFSVGDPEPDAGGFPAKRRAENGPPAPTAGGPAPVHDLPDQPARTFAVDPHQNVVLEASAGTGKTTVLVQRYVNLLRAGVDPSNILAMTFTRKAAAEMRERIIRELKRAATLSQADRARWNTLRDRLSDIDISTIDAFCLSLLREFPLEADLDPGFSMADETEVPRLMDDALDRALRICLLRAREDEDLALVLAQLGLSRARTGLTHLLHRRLVARQALDRFLVRGPDDLRIADVCRASIGRLQDALRSLPDGLDAFLQDGPLEHPRFRLLARDLAELGTFPDATPAVVRGLLDRIRQHFLTRDGTPRLTSGSFPPYRREHSVSGAAWKGHREGIAAAAPLVKEVLDGFARDLNVILARGIRRMFWIAFNEYRKTLEDRSVLDFSDVLERAIALLGQMDEFAQSRYRLEARYHHVLVDEFQDTSRAQWQLVSLLIEAWGQGSGVASDAPLPPSIFVVGDRKQSIYRFRDAEVTVLDEASRYIAALRPGGVPVRQAIAYSFRAHPGLLAFVNDVFTAVDKQPRADAFTYAETDRFPLPSDRIEDSALGDGQSPLGIVAGDTPEGCAAAVADEIRRLLGRATVRDRDTGAAREARAGDIAILFRSRASHREFEDALDARGVATYVYKGLGFFDADEIKDLLALLRYLADPSSDLRTAAFLRSRFVRISDEGLCRLAPRLALALGDSEVPGTVDQADAARLLQARRSVATWLELADRVPPAELLDRVLSDTAYDYELRGPRRAQARENVKKMRALIRRIQNRGYATLRRIAEHLDSLSAGDESNATLEAVDAVNLMTVHAAKGLEFPIVFVVNLAKGSGGPQPPVRVVADTPDGEPSVSVATYISEVDEDRRDRDAEETKRLLYVAMTRARDVLYLATVLKDGEMRPMRGSLGEMMPAGVRALFSSAVRGANVQLEWVGPSGRSHTIRLVPAAPTDDVTQPPRDHEPARCEAFGPLAMVGDRLRVSATEFARARRGSASAEVRADEPAPPHASHGDRMVGTLVHRLFQDGWVSDDLTLLERRASQLLRAEEQVSLERGRGVAIEAASLYQALAHRADVAEAMAGGICEYEVPFALKVAPSEDNSPGAIVRGSIDCLVIRPGGRVSVLEFKTGRPRAEHERQLETYLAAVRAIFPGAEVDGRIVYP